MSNNKIENLRISNSVNNNHNITKRKNTVSQYIGVQHNKNNWASYIQKNNKSYYLETYKLEIEASIAYNIKAKELYGSFANLNDISEEDFNKYYKEIFDNVARLNK